MTATRRATSISCTRSGVLSVPSKRYAHKKVGFLARDEVEVLFAAPDRRIWRCFLNCSDSDFPRFFVWIGTHFPAFGLNWLDGFSGHRRFTLSCPCRGGLVFGRSPASWCPMTIGVCRGPRRKWHSSAERVIVAVEALVVQLATWSSVGFDLLTSKSAIINQLCSGIDVTCYRTSPRQLTRLWKSERSHFRNGNHESHVPVVTRSLR